MKPTRWIRFLGGKNLLFTLVAGSLLGLFLFIFYKVRFLFVPLEIIFKTVFAPLLLGVVLYYLMNPIVDYCERKGWKRLYAIIGVFSVILLLLIAFGLWLVPEVYKQTTSLLNDFPSHVERFDQTLQNALSGTALETPVEEAFESLEEIVYQLIRALSTSIGDIQQFIGTIFSTISGFFILLFTAPIITFFLLKDARQFYSFVLKVFPPRFRQDVTELGKILNSQVGSYLKGQFFVALANGVILFLGFVVIGMPYKLPLALLVTVTSFIPYIGAFIAFVPCVVIAMFESVQLLIGLLLVWGVEQILNSNVIEPKVLGEHLKVHPVTIMLVLLVMGNLFGLFGLVFGIPTYTVFRAFGVFLFRKFKQRYNRYYGEKEPYEETEFSKENYPAE